MSCRVAHYFQQQGYKKGEVRKKFFQARDVFNVSMFSVYVVNPAKINSPLLQWCYSIILSVSHYLTSPCCGPGRRSLRAAAPGRTCWSRARQSPWPQSCQQSEILSQKNWRFCQDHYLRIQFAGLFNHLVTNGLLDLLVVISPLLHLITKSMWKWHVTIHDTVTCPSCHWLNHFQLARVTMAHVVLVSRPLQKYKLAN